MDQNYNSSQNDFLWTLLANPADDAYRYNYNLQRLVNDFPQSGILQALLAHSSEEKNLKQASVYFNAKSLYKLINSPSSLIGVSDEKIIVQNGSRPVSFNGYLQQDTDTGNAENYFSDNTAVETVIAAEEQPAIEHEIAQPVVEEHHAAAVEPAAPVEAYIENMPVAGHPVNTIEEAPVPLVAGPEAAAAEPVINHEINETSVSEIKEHAADEAPAAAPIVNYAFGLGHRLPPEPEATGEIPPAPPAEPQVEETHTGSHETAPDVSYQHSVEENITDAHLPPPVPAEAPAHLHAAELDTPPPVAAEHKATDPIVAEYRDFEEPPAVEHLQAAQPPVTEHFLAGNYEHNEPVQQYRPWDEPATEVQQPAEIHIQQEETPAFSPQPEVKDEHIETPELTDTYKPWQPATTEARHNDTHTIEEQTFDEITGIENIAIDQDIISNIAATDFFGFDRAFGEHKGPEPAKQSVATEPVNEQPGDADQQDLSKYHDEKMPYSFLWWLDKTRKEHTGVYQPYVAPAHEGIAPAIAKSKSGTDELQQQYYENIFHITSVDELDKSVPLPPYAAAPAFSEKKKEQLIIERFIQEEPQIRPQSSDKLDNENKAKKSSEDRDELVSETLAAIYSDQMLYHKAIASYKKLILKFPEKSRYFAAKIEQLEKKTN